MSKLVSRSEVDRLGKRGSYRLGGPRQAGTWSAGTADAVSAVIPRTAAPRLGGRLDLFALLSTGLIAGGALLGLWFMPFVAGLATGVVMRWAWWRLRVTVPAVLIMACAGWGLALWSMAARGQAVGPTARTIASLAGYPEHGRARHHLHARSQRPAGTHGPLGLAVPSLRAAGQALRRLALRRRRGADGPQTR